MATYIRLRRNVPEGIAPGVGEPVIQSAGVGSWALKVGDGASPVELLPILAAPAGGEGGGPGIDGRTPELRSSGSWVQWKWTTEPASAWRNLYQPQAGPPGAASTVPGPPGAASTVPGPPGASATVTLVPASAWPPAADANPLHLYVKVPG